MTSHAQLTLSFHGRIIDSLGIQMYQSPVAAIAELVSNAWDADAEVVYITLPTSLDDSATIIIKDDGLGMTLAQCQDRYLQVGRNRREEDKTDTSVEKHRPVLGRKGIGKFAGFGIAQKITIETISKETGEKTIFSLDMNDLRSDEFISTKAKPLPTKYEGPDPSRIDQHGTKITLSLLNLKQKRSADAFAKSMARRFLLLQSSSDFAVKVDGNDLPKEEDLAGVEFTFPQELINSRPGLTIDGEGWAEESLPDGNKVRWRAMTTLHPIDVEEIRGISIFCRGKLAQNSFFFDLTGGLSAQFGQEYLTGQIEADFLDEGEDFITTERQRISWEHSKTAALKAWGQELIKQLLKEWKQKRIHKNEDSLTNPAASFHNRLADLNARERRTIETVLKKIAALPAMESKRFQDFGGSLLTAWERGRLGDLLDDLAEVEDMNEHDLLNILTESKVVTALQISEHVNTQLDIIAGLKGRIEARDLENAIRDYIAKNPWLISPKWETFRKEVGLNTLQAQFDKDAGIKADDAAKRIDLILASGEQLLIVELMRPGLKVDSDHLNRFEKYVDAVRTYIEGNTAKGYRTVTGVLIADKLEDEPLTLKKLQRLKDNSLEAMDWTALFHAAEAQWNEYREAVKERAPDDERVQSPLSSASNSKPASKALTKNLPKSLSGPTLFDQAVEEVIAAD